MRSHRAVLNFIFSFARNLIGTVLSLATTPFILSAIGEERFGAYRILLDWLSHLSVLEFGLYSASLTLLSKATTEKSQGLRGTIKLIFRSYLFVFFMQVVVLVIFSSFLNYLIPVSTELQKELQISALILSFSLLFILSQIFKSFLEATQKGYLVSVVMVVFNLVYLLQCVLYAYLGWGLIGQTVAYVSSLFASLGLFVFFAPEVLANIFGTNVKDQPHQLLKKQRFSHFISELCSRISLMSDNIIISLFMGASTVTAFFITQKVGSMMQQQLQHISNSSWAALSELHYQGKKDLFNERILQLTELTSFCSGAFLSVVCLLNPSFISLWTGSHTFSGMSVSNLTSVNAALFSILSLWSWCFAATNLANKIITLSIVQGVVNIIASIVLTQHYGVVGPLYGTLIGYVGVSLFWKSYVLCKTFDMSYKHLTIAWARPLLPPLLITIIYLYYFGPPKADSWTMLFFSALVLTPLFIFGCYFILISSATQRLLTEILTRALKKFKSA
ncbi:MAG: oligosaccharide flippase family protein [Bdellovibrionaceae bacterium]|nr:oligosaccharide flippase family protein [Pseudobdellovibrionaceae bacterium]